MIRKLVLSAVSFLALTSAVNADNGVTGGAVLPDTWTWVVPSQCFLQPWGENRVTLSITPTPWKPNKFLWTTDDATIALLAPRCSYADDGFWVYSPNGKTWYLALNPT